MACILRMAKGKIGRPQGIRNAALKRGEGTVLPLRFYTSEEKGTPCRKKKKSWGDYVRQGQADWYRGSRIGEAPEFRITAGRGGKRKTANTVFRGLPKWLKLRRDLLLISRASKTIV